MLKQFLMAGAMAAAVAIAFADAASAQVRLRLAVGANESETDGMSVGLRALRDYARYKSNGEIQIEIFWNTLGGSLQVTEQVKNGELDMALTDDSVLGSFHKPMQSFQIPYLFSSSPAAWEFVNSDVVRGMVEDMRKATGIRTLAFSENGFRNITNNQRPIRTPDDMAGLKMRTMQSQVYVQMMQSMGATATPISWPELVPALRTGVVDGQENAAVTVLDGKLYEVQKYMSVNEHVYGFHLIIMNDDRYRRLSPDHRRIIREAAQVHASVANSRKVQGSMSAVEELKSRGMTVHVNSPTEKAAFRETSQKAVIEFIASQVGKETVDRVLAAAREAETRLYGD
jgi:C4-dicarboxylate-binding protein DctP